jgi:hypothetical protein
MQEMGGAMTMWQIAFDEEESTNVETSTVSDVLFTFSNQWTRPAEEKNGSKIPYHVSTGFLGFNRELLRPRALELRQQLHAKGVNKIVACFYEYSLDDYRWNFGHKVQQKHYRLLLEKVLNHLWLGVIFKPKQPNTLRKRLADVSVLLEEAEETGCCIVLDSAGLFQSNIPPVLVVLDADVAIQGHINAGTTALEFALAGIPTLSVDLEGFRLSRIYDLGERKVVFRNYEDIWETVQDQWNSKGGVPVFGDWTP